jgi:hypothetical protein
MYGAAGVRNLPERYDQNAEEDLMLATVPVPVLATHPFSFCTFFQQLGELEALILIVIVAILLVLKGGRFIIAEYYELRREIQKGKLSVRPEPNPASSSAAIER